MICGYFCDHQDDAGWQECTTINKKEITVDTALLSMGAKALRKAALNNDAKQFMLNNPILFQTFKRAADRYIGGETLIETVQKVITENTKGHKCSMEFMGENTSTSEEAIAATDEFLRISDVIAEQRLNSTVSLDLSHIGLAISKDLCRENLEKVCMRAASNNTEVIISAEGVDATDQVLDMYLEVAKKYTNLSITLQAYLHRSKDDFKTLLSAPGRIRMVKGAFETPAELSIARGSKLDEVYIEYVDQLLSSGHLCSIATHHDYIQQACKKLVTSYGVSPDQYEFESLYGIRNDQLLQLKAEGYHTKVYFVYGKEWYLYLCNRIAEYPLNIFQALKDIVDAPMAAAS